jgi:hypothetical protein
MICQANTIMKRSNRLPISKSLLTLLLGSLILPAALAANKSATKNSPPCAVRFSKAYQTVGA